MKIRADLSLGRRWICCKGMIEPVGVVTRWDTFELLGHERRGVEEANAANPQLPEQLNSRGVDERNVRQLEGQPDPVAESVQIAGSPKLLNPAVRHPTFHSESYCLS